MAKLKKQLIKELEQIKVKLLAHKVATGLISLALVFTLGSVAFAGAGWLDKEKVHEDLVAELKADALDEASPVDEGFNLGAVSSPFLPGPEFGVGKDWQYSVTAELADATSTWAFASPFRMATSTASQVVVETLVTGYGLTVPTSTVELVSFSITSSTPSTYLIGCGSSSSPYTTSTNSVSILLSDVVPADWGGGVIENNVANTSGAEVGGGTVAKIQVGPSHPYIVCRALPDGAQFSGADGVSLGNIAIRFSKVQ